jgi:transcriptional regulator with XRE-family HTH domain
MKLTKQQALSLFDSGAQLGRALGISRSAISQWPAVLEEQQTAMVIGAAILLGKTIPEGFITAAEQAAA